MAKKLKNLQVTKVDFVDEGANPDADIPLFKRKEQAPAAIENADALDEDTRSFLKRLADVFRATFAADEPVDEGQVEKTATTFSEEYRLRNLDKIVDDMWNLCYALNNSLCSIIFDEDMDTGQKQSAMTDSVNEFNATIKQAIENWTTGEPYGIVLKTDDETVSESMISAMKSIRDRLSASIEKAATPDEGQPLNNYEPKGEETDMKFDKSKMTPAERAMLEQFEKNYGMEDDVAPATEVPATAPATGAVVEPTMKAATKPTPANDDGDIFKGMSPELKAEFEALKKFREDTEDAELRNIAKGYEIIGKSADDLFPVLKMLKKSDPAYFEQFVATLNSAKETVEKSGAFAEIGKAGTGSVQQGGAVKEAETKAAELMKSKNGLTWAQAIDEVLQADPALAERYEKED